MRRTFAARLHRLSVREVQNARDGDHGDGAGLVLRVRGSSAVWVLRFTAPSGRRREMGLGIAERQNAAAAGKSLTQVRQLAQDAREKLLRSIDPIDARDAERNASKEALRRSQRAPAGLTLARACRRYHEKVIEGNRSPKHAGEWLRSLEFNITAELWNAPVADITGPQLFDAIAALQRRVPETARRCRQRLEVVFDDLVFRGLRSDNPAAAIRRKLREVQGRRERGHFNALPYREIPQFVVQLRAMEGVAPRCLEFLLLTAARTTEAIECEWSEINIAERTWVVPARRMKGNEPHTVYLSDRALELLAVQRGLHSKWVFPSPAGLNRPLSNGGMQQLLVRMKVAGQMTVHGCRASFATAAGELFGARPDAIEACLAHRESNLVKAAYQRGQFASERRALLEAWADFVDGKTATSNVVDLRPRAA